MIALPSPSRTQELRVKLEECQNRVVLHLKPLCLGEVRWFGTEETILLTGVCDFPASLNRSIKRALLFLSFLVLTMRPYPTQPLTPTYNVNHGIGSVFS